MARVDIPVQTIPRNGGGIQNVSLSAAFEVDDHEFENEGDTLLIAFNLSGGAHSLDIIATPNEYGRAVDSSGAVPAAVGGVPGISIAGPFKKDDWNQAGGNLVHVDILTATDLHFAAVKYSKEG